LFIDFGIKRGTLIMAKWNKKGKQKDKIKKIMFENKMKLKKFQKTQIFRRGRLSPKSRRKQGAILKNRKSGSNTAVRPKSRY